MSEVDERPAYDSLPLKPPSADNGLLAVFQRRYLLRLLVQREISARYQGSFLGLLWSYINPMTQFFIYWFVFGIIFNTHKSVPNFAIHLFAGLIIVHFFTESFSSGTQSIVRNKALVVKQAMPREMFPVSAVLVSFYHVLPQMLILLVACGLSGWRPDAVGMVAFVLALVIIIFIGTGCALLFSAANVFFRDFGNIVNVFNHFVRYGVTMMFPWAYVQERLGDHAGLFLLNPLADAVLLFQRAFWVGTASPEERAKIVMPDHLMLHGVAVLGISLLFLVVGQLVFSRLENKIPERL
ncbi:MULTISPECIES: ABC transporter permease [unclassified Nocardioides]|uniref:ABC transporter permease n=1 Tax=unclassified Nocardioides TaxID=2615069 RepID=UPI0006FCC052|nr:MULTISPECIES: ABC transporter permease [unclassified Nocardioides]KRA31466.1 ABC transporter [Nocardioides sp. Root614]KRA88086.1 ABC transporter [Nocardioides sp. Root682]